MPPLFGLFLDLSSQLTAFKAAADHVTDDPEAEQGHFFLLFAIHAILPG
jgi:hypothetical protein